MSRHELRCGSFTRSPGYCDHGNDINSLWKRKKGISTIWIVSKYVPLRSLSRHGSSARRNCSQSNNSNLDFKESRYLLDNIFVALRVFEEANISRNARAKRKYAYY